MSAPDTTGTEVQIKHAQFKYYLVGKATDPKTGKQIDRLIPRIATRDQVLTIPRQEDVDRGEALGAFYTDADYEDDTPDAVEAVPATNEHDELVAWIRDQKPTAPQVVEAAGDDPERAQAMLDAENEASGGDPRKSVVEPLNKIIEG